MILPISDFAKCEVSGFIPNFTIAEIVTAANIYHAIFSIYSNVMPCRNVADCYEGVNNDWTNYHDKERNGKPWIVTEKFIQKIEELIREDRRRWDLRKKCVQKLIELYIMKRFLNF